MRQSENGLFEALENVLRESGRAMDCNELFDMPSVREHAASANRVSDYLGGLWRKGKVHRVPQASEGSKARWSYQWKDRSPADVIAKAVPHAPKVLVDRPTLMIQEEGKTIHLVTPNLTITIKMT